MSAASRLGIRGEFVAAGVLGTKRVRRERYKSTPDMSPVRLPSGRMLQGEAKTRKRLAAWMRKALAQAAAYTADAIPVVVLVDPQGEPLALFRARDIARELGLTAPDLQLRLALPTERAT